MQLTRCPECDGAAEIDHRAVLESTHGPIEHVKLRCVQRHWYFVSTSYLDGVPAAAPHRSAAHHRR
jgi:hypothetical protein